VAKSNVLPRVVGHTILAYYPSLLPDRLCCAVKNMYEEPMQRGTLADLDFSKWEEPEPTADLRRNLEQWLGYQHHEFVRKLRDF
jgi:hypothetical protein